MRKHRYRVKTKRLIAGLIAAITILNPLLENSAGVIQTIAAEEALTAEKENQLITVRLNEMDAGNSVKEKEVVTGENYGTLPTPIREGYIFEGWYTEKSEGIHITETTEVQANISELFAHWRPVEIKVDLYGFGTDGLESNSIVVVYGHTFSNLPLLEKEGYVFEGWFTSPDGETQISNQSQVTVTSPMALYARWSGKKVEVTFDESDAVVNPSSMMVEIGGTYGDLPIPEREGYDFCGWFIDEIGATEITADTIVSIQEEHVLYAGWQEQECKIKLDVCGGKCTKSTIKVKVGEAYGELPVASYDGHVFLGWYDGIEQEANRITSETIVPINAPETLCAKWKANNYTVTLVPLIDGIEKSIIEVTYGEAYEKLPELFKENYKFLGWYTKTEEGRKIENTDVVEITSDQTLYAQWEGNNYTVIFDALGGSVSTVEKEVIYGTAYGTLPSPTKKGYVFDGWFTSPSGKTLITEDDKVTLTENQTLYAHWTPKQADITLNANGGQMIYNGECLESCVLQKEYDECYEELPIPWREGYKFMGWYTNKLSGKEITNVSKVQFTTDAVLYAHWAGNEYTVFFDAMGGVVNPKSMQVITGENYGELPIPEKKNYVFTGWYTALEDGDKIIKTTNSRLTGNQTLYAAYEGIKITITYDANGGSCSKKSATVSYGNAVKSLPTPTKAGYLFKGWYTAKGTKIEVGDTLAFSEDITLYARWEETTYTVTFNPNGGIASSTEKEVLYGQSYGALPKASREGYSFVGWFTSKTGDTQISGSDIVNISADMTLYAHWSVNKYTVTFQMNGGTASVQEKTVTFGKIYNTLPSPKRSGYTFAGWYTKDRYGSKVTANSDVEIAKDHTLYAKWTSEIFVITFKPNGGTVDVTNVAVPVGTSYGAFPVPEREGYNFAGWYTKISGGTRIYSLSAKDTLYAHWTGKNYTVYFDAVDGSITQKTKKVVYAETYGTLPTPTKQGMEFAGWYTAKTGGTKVTGKTVMKVAGNHTLYARWKGVSSKLSYEANGGKEITTKKTITFGESYGTLSTPSRTGYTFLGWYTSPTGGTKITSDTIVAVTKNQTLYAHWEPKEITIRFSANGGRVVVNGYKVAIEERVYRYGQKYGEFPVPQKVGYTFLGWYTTTSTTGTKITESEICKKTTDDVLYACWSGVKNKVLFDANGGEVDERDRVVTYGEDYGTLPTPIRKGYSFSGWYDQKTGGTKITASTQVELLAAQTLYAQWEVEEYVLTLNGNGGGYSVKNSKGETSWVTTSTRSIPYGCNYVGKKTNFRTFSRKGYYFNGFYTEPEGGTQINIDTEFLHDTKQTIYAQWIPLKVNVLYETGNADDIYQCSKLTYGSEYGLLPVVSRTGYSFNGWSVEGSSKLIDEATLVGTAKAHSLKAKWTANQYTLYYDANGGSVDETSKTVTYGADIGTLEKPTRDGYKFEGWYTQRTGGYKVSASDTYVKTEDMTVFAHWTKVSDKITLYYKANGGKCSESSKTIYPGYAYGDLAAAQRKGYVFTGWYRSSQGTGLVTEGDNVTDTADVSLYAGWDAKESNVFFDSTGGSVGVSVKTVSYGETYGELPVPTKDYYTFNGWYTQPENGTKILESSKVNISDTTILYAQWIPMSYEVHFDANGGSAEYSEKTIVSGTELGELPAAERRGYELTGWYTSPDNGDAVSETYIVSGEEITLYAQWKPLEIVVTLDAQDGTVQTAEKQVLFGEAYGDLPDAVLPGYQFVGWYLEKEGQTKIENKTVVDVENNHTLFAYYVKKDDIPQAEIQEFYFGEEGANPASGNISFSVTDMVMNIPGLEQELVRTYNSKDRVPKSLGTGWTFGFEASYELYADGAIVYLPNGSVDVFVLTEDGYEGNNNHNKLQVNEDGSAVLTQKDQVKYGFQNDGRLAYIEDRNGNRTKVSYTNGMISELCDPVGRAYTITANLDGLITEITDPMGGKVIYAYDENNLLTHVTNLLGGVTTYEYDKNGYLDRIIDPNDNVIQEFEYVDSVALDGAEISRSMDAYGGITEYAYYEEDNYTVITDESGRKWTYWYDSNMRVTAVQNPDGSMYTTEYVEYEEGIYHADVKSTTDEYGSKNQYEYDANGNIIKATYADGSTEEFLYDEFNNLLMKRSETGEHTYFCYDKDGINLLKQVQKTNGGEIKLTPENAYEVLAGITAKDGGYIVIEFDYYTKDEAKGMFDCNLSGLLESETNAEGESFAYTYDQYGNTATETDIAGNVKQYTYDMLGHKLSEVTPNGDEFKWSYMPNGYATREYYPDGGVAVSQYDLAGHLTQTVSQELYEAEKDYGDLYKGKTGTFYEYNSNGRLGSITDVLGNKVEYTYDCSGNLIKEEVEGAEVYSYEYDERDRLVKQWYQETAKEPKVLLKEAAYEVTEAGGYQVKTTYYADSETGVTQVTVYDEKGRVKEEYILAGEEKAKDKQYTYFADNRVASVKEGEYATYYQYNVLGNVTQLLEPVERENGEVLYRKTVYEYDRAGRMTKELVYHSPVARDSISLFMQAPETDTTVYYYEDGLLVKETNSNGVSTHYSYDADGNVIQILVGEGTPEDGTARKITQGFDFRKNMIYQTQYLSAEDLEGQNTASGNLVALTTTYAYDKEGRLVEETSPDGIKTVYEYDAAGNQIALQKPVLDEAGNTIGEYRVSAEYNAKGQRVSFTDALGNVTRYYYDNRGNLLRTEDALGGISLTEYNYNNQKVLEVSPANYLDGQATEKMSRTEYIYDDAGRLAEIIDYTMENGTLVNKAVQSHEYNSDGHVVRSTDAEGNATEFGYTPAGQLAYEISANGNRTDYGYDIYGQLSEIDNGINSIYYKYDFSGNLLETGDVYGTMERFTYDMFGNAVTHTDGNGNQTRYNYNAFGEVASTALPEDETIGGLTTYYRYDMMGRVKMVYDTEGNITRYAYDSMGNVTQVVMEDPESGKKVTASAEYDINSQEVMRVDAAGLKTESTYDALGRLAEQKTYSSTEQGKQKTVSYTYDANGNLLSETDWLGNTIRREYDAWNRLTAEYDALGYLMGAYTYDNVGNQTTVTDALGNTTRYEYDEVGKLKILTDATGAESIYTYDAAGNVASVTDALGYSHQYSYDGRNRLVSATIPTGDTVEYTYDNNDNLLVQKDGNGNRTVYEYNVRNLEISRQDAATEDNPNLTAPKETKHYNADGSLLEAIDRNGVSTAYRYDAFGRVAEENAGGNAKNYVYDTAGNVLITANGAEIVERTYDLEGRVISKTVNGIGTVVYEYDIPLGQGECAETMSTPDGVVTTTVYDAVGRIREVSDNMGNSVHYVYNANGSRQATVYADGTREDYIYDAAQRVIQLKHTDAYGNLLDYYEYSYDPNGNLLEEVSNRGVTTYTYDGADRLESVTEPEGRKTVYTYDAAGNRKTMETWYGTELAEKRTYVYDERNCLIAETVDGTTNVSYEYDANGNLLKKVAGTERTQTATGQAMTLTFDAAADVETATGSAVELYTYDTYNRLTSYEGGDTYAEYGYNAEDYRCYKNVQENGFFDETYYFYEGSHVIMEADSTGTINAHNMYGTHLAARTVDGQSCYYLYNAHGDVVMLVDAVTGEVVGTYQYDAFGTLLWSDGYADNSITYAGYQYDEESGLYYLNARYYDSTTARFLTEDTYRGRQNDPLSLNRYTYCHNNPLIYWDPTGHEAQKYEEDYFVSLTTGNRHPRCKLGSRGSYVCQMERILEAAGYRPGDSSDGIFDENTLRAVKLFQRDNGLNVTGIVEQKAWAYLQIQQDLKRLESRYKCREISKEEYESYVNGLKRKANNVPYMYDDITPEDVEREMYSRFYVGLTIETSLLEAQAMVLTMGASEIMGDGVDLIYDVSNALVNPSPNAVGSIVFDSVCLLIPDGPLNYADNVADDAVDVWRRTGKGGSTTIHNDILDSPRVGSALKVDDVKPIYKINEKTGKPQIIKEFPATAQSHGFNDIIDNYAGYATKTPLNNATLYQLEGSLNGVAGRFEWIIQDGNVTHRMFIQNGTMNGVPIKP